MPIVHKRVRLLGREPIPRFAREGTLCWLGYEDPDNAFPEQWSIYNIAALALYPRAGAIGLSFPPRSVTYWSHTTIAGVDNIFGQDTIVIPHDCEWYSVAWLTPPQDWVDNTIPPEEYFRMRWDLAI